MRNLKIKAVVIAIAVSTIPLSFNACGKFSVGGANGLVIDTSTVPGSNSDSGSTTAGGSTASQAAVLAASASNSFPDLSIPGMCTSNILRGTSREGIRKLSKTQLLRTLQVLFPTLFDYYAYPESYYHPTYDVMGAYPPDVSDDPTENFNPLHLNAQVSAWADIADDIAQKVAAKTNEIESYAGGNCISASTITRDCWTQFLSKLGRASYRRPLTQDELDGLITEIPSGNNQAAIQTMISRFLRSPNTIFIVESGNADASGRRRLTDYEIATRLAYDLTNAPPDSILASAAESGKLQSLANVQAQAKRLITTDLAKARFREFVSDWMRVYRVGNANADVATYFGIESAGSYTGRWATQEIFDYTNYVIYQKNGNFNDLMTSAIAFPLNQNTSIAYGTGTTKDSSTPISTPDHPGLLTRVGLLQSGSSLTSPINRGVNVIRRVECTNLPSPDFSVVASRTAALASLDPNTMANWQMVQQVTAPTNCMACHSQINSIGFVFESFNALGMKRNKDEFIFDNGSTGARIVASFDLPAAQSFHSPDSGTNVSVSSPNEIIATLGQSSTAKACMTVRAFRDIQKRAETINDSCALSEAIGLMNQGVPIIDVLVQLVANEDIFWRGGQ